MAKTAAYGAWRSPITSELLVEQVVGPGQILTEGTDVYWNERRPTEEGRQVIVVVHEDGSTEDLLPLPYSARTLVHEYGGLSYCVRDGVVYFANFADQRLYRRDLSGLIEPITPEPESSRATRFADLVVSLDGNHIVCVRERHGVDEVPGTAGVINDVVRVATDGSGDLEVLAFGYDFYLAPRLSPDGTRLVYLAWNMPNMPWDATELFGIDLHDRKGVNSARLIAGGSAESISQPRFGRDGTLYYLSDRSGFWNLYEESGRPRFCVDAECSAPDWQFGQSTYFVQDDQSVVIALSREGATHLAVVDGTGVRELHHPLTTFGSLAKGADGTILALAGSAKDPLAVVRIDSKDNSTTELRSSRKVNIDPGYISIPRHLTFLTTGGLEAYALFYPPKNRDFQGAPGERPPLIVQCHGGPTSQARQLFDPEIQYFTSRGFAVVDVDYGGSSGYGRAYRERLTGNWGVVDVDDCTNAALALVDRGRVDRRRLIIHGSSAGGYTTLACLTFRKVFAAGASYYGVSDLASLASDSHKFESRYLDSLVGRLPEDASRYEERSPLAHARELKCPVIFFQGLEDAVVPPAQAEMMVEALHRHGIPSAYLAFEGEQHGFRKASTIVRAIEAELSFYAQVLDIPISDHLEPVTINDASLLIH